MDWNDLKIVLAVYRGGSASAAAARLNVSHATVSRRISDIESALGILLVDRSGLSWRPTPVCAKIAAEAAKMESSHQEASRLATAFTSQLDGPVHISVPTETVSAFVARALAELPALAPDIQLIFHTEDSHTDLSARKADLAVRFTDSPDPDLIGYRIGPSRWAFYSNAQIARQLAHQSKDSPLRAPLLTTDPDGGFPPWAAPYFAPDCTCHYVYGYRQKAMLARFGFGVMMMPRIIGDAIDGVERLDGLPCPMQTMLWVLANADTRSSKRIALVRKTLVAGLRSLAEEMSPSTS